MRLLLKILFLFTLLYAHNASAQSLYFLSGGKEIEISYTGKKSNPDTISFNVDCDPSYCASNTKVRRVMGDFTRALVNRRIYTYVKDTSDRGTCLPGQACFNPLKYNETLESDAVFTKASAAVFIQARSTGKKKNDSSFLQDIWKEVRNATISGGIEEGIDYLTSDKNKKVDPPEFLIYTNKDGVLIRFCEVKPGGLCEEVEEVVIDDDGDSIGVAIENFDLNEAFDRMVERALIDFLYEQWAARRCERRYTGPSGDKTAQIVCWKPR